MIPANKVAIANIPIILLSIGDVMSAAPGASAIVCDYPGQMLSLLTFKIFNMRNFFWIGEPEWRMRQLPPENPSELRNVLRTIKQAAARPNILLRNH